MSYIKVHHQYMEKRTFSLHGEEEHEGSICPGIVTRFA